MPKRPCPFGETFSTQYKIHVGQKELNQHGVFGNEYRQEIYEKTKNLLFNGTKAIMEKLWKADAEHNPRGAGDACPGVPEAGGQMLLQGQTLIGRDGRLTKTSAVTGAQGVAATCSACQKMARTRTLCAHCERQTCAPCMRTCSDCCRLCCSVCTVVDYSSRDDRVLCFDCSV